LATARDLMSADHFKIGLFSLNASGGIAMTKVPERWHAGWPEIAKAAQMADEAGLDFLLPLQRWRGYGGETDPRGWCMETTAHAAGLASLTKRIAIFATVQVPIVHPAWAARAIATLDHVSNGRAGLNIVCGWNEHDFAMFGVTDVGPDRRFDQGAEWTQVFARMVKGEVFDHEGEFFKLKGAFCSPSAFQDGGPVLMSAAFSPPGREFAARHCDVLFTTISSIDNGQRHISALAELPNGQNLKVFTPVHVVCRPTREEALAYYERFAETEADHGAVDNYIAENSRSGKRALAVAMQMQRKRIAGGFGSYGMVGSPDDIAAEMIALHEAGFAGLSVSFVDFAAELPFFVETVLPRLRSAGIRS
jgi:FMNH2-dependent dimethyl sulfone monooxygenase